MNRYQRRPYGYQALVRTIGVSLVVMLGLMVVACGTTPQASVPEVSTPLATITTSLAAATTEPVPPSDATHFAQSTAEIQYREHIETVVALTPPPTPPTPEPERATPTLEYGSIECSSGDNRYPNLLSCWRVILNGHSISVGSGMPGSSMEADPNQGLFFVFHGPYWDTSDPATEVYSTPLKLGSIRIVAVSGTQFTVAPVDMRTPFALVTPWTTATPGTTFVFDLATRKWISAGPGPSTSTPATSQLMPNSPGTLVNASANGHPPTPDPNDKAEFATAVADHDDELSTEVALEPTWTPGELPIYPTATPEMGMLRGCASTSSRYPQCYNAWRGVINGEIIQVDAGREGLDGDESQGLLMVNNWNRPGEDATYLTPQKVGAVQMVSVDGMRFTVAVISTPWTMATPGTTFVFDLATRQWVSP